jgi:TRAP-type C4-dicarboxylate transport system permease small subunit
MSALFDVLPAGGRRWLMMLIALVTSLVMFALAFFSIRYIGSVASSGRVLSSLQVPVWWIFLWVPVGLSVTGVQYLLTALKNLVSSDAVYLSTEVRDGYDRN